MKIELSQREKLIVAVVFFSLLTGYSSIVLVAEYGSTTIKQLAVNQPLTVGEVKRNIDGSNSFEILAAGKAIGSANTPFTVKTNDSALVVDVSDSVSVPYLYQPRMWREVYVNDQLAVSGQTHILSYVAGGLWGVPLVGLTLIQLRKRGKKQD